MFKINSLKKYYLLLTGSVTDMSEHQVLEFYFYGKGGLSHKILVPHNKRGMFSFLLELSFLPEKIEVKYKNPESKIYYNIEKIGFFKFIYLLYHHNIALFVKGTKIKKEIKRLGNISLKGALLKPHQTYKKAQESRVIINSKRLEQQLTVVDKTIYEKFLRDMSYKFKVIPESIAVVVLNNNSKINDFKQFALSDMNQITISKKINLRLLKNIVSKYTVLISSQDTILEGIGRLLAIYISKHGYPEIVYFDHYKEDLTPILKSDWNFYYFLHYDYISRAVLFRTDILEKLINSQNLEFNKHLHYKLLLKAYLEHNIKPAHIPLPMFIIQDEKNPSDWDEGLSILKGYFGENISKYKWENTYIYKPNLVNETKVSIIIPTKDKSHLLKKCIYSVLQKTSYKNYEVIIVDNNSVEEDTFKLYEEISKYQNIRILNQPIHFNFSKLVNYGIKEATGEYIVLMNNDTEVINEDWLEWFVRYLNIKEVGVVGAKLFYPDGKIQHAGVVVGLYGLADHAFKGCDDSFGYMGRLSLPQEYLAVTAACMGFRREIFDKVGGFEEELAVNFNDLDFCLKAYSQGYKIIYLPQVQLIHYEHASRGKDDTPEKMKRAKKEKEYIQKKWKKFIEHDPYYNPNLTIMRNDFSFASPRFYWLE